MNMAERTSSASGLYQCGFCQKTYARPDHLVRHVRSHTSDKPFVCDKCHKGFGRIDILRRHAEGHRRHSGPRDPLRRSASPSRVRARVSRACRHCAASKLKCDDSKPCRRCLRRSLVCQEPEREDSPDPLEIQPRDVDDTAGVSALGVSASSRHIASNQCEPQETVSMAALAPASDYIPEPNMEIDAPVQNRLPLMASYEDIVEDSLNFELGLTNRDLEFLDSLYNNNTNFEVHSEPLEAPARGPSQSRDSQGPRPAQDPAYSPLADWTPRAEDNAYMDRKYLAVPKDLDRATHTGSLKSRVSPEALSRESRDAVFAAVVLTCQERNLYRIMHCFPSAELLDSLIQDFFVHQRSRLLSWIHEPTVWLNQDTPEFILSLAAAGAVLSPVTAIQRLGYALLEIARLQLSKRYESDNSLTRHLRQLQTFALVLEIGLWSGDKRRVEIAESFEQPVVTMLRRSSRFKAYPIVVPPETDDPETLNRCWHEWVELESYKRLVYHLFVHDAQASIHLSTNRLLSYGELELSLPYSRELWEAKNAAEWKTMYLQESPQPRPALPSLVDILQDLPTLNELHHHGDLPLAALVSIYGLSGIVADCDRTRYGPGGSWNALLFQSWQRELQMVLEQFGTIVRETSESDIPVVSLAHQAVSLSLYMPLRVLELLAGKDGEGSSARVRRSIIERISAQHLRQASWHAGQLLRICRSMEPGSLVGFNATCLYFAALALWTYDTVAEKGSKTGSRSAGRSTVFFLDGEVDPSAMNRYITYGQGEPALSNADSPVYLDNRLGMMNVFQDVLQANHVHGGVPEKLTSFCNILLALGRFSNLSQV